MRVADRLREWVPRWWRGEAGWAGSAVSGVLIPAEVLFSAGVAVRNALYDRERVRVDRSPIPVVSVGNVTVGGTGKTPVCAWIAGVIRDWGHRPGVVLRGYGRDEVEVHRELNPGIPIIASRRRIEGVEQALAKACDCVVLDDGFQHRSLARDLDIVLIAAESWTDARRMLPRGPWREPLDALGRAGYVLVTRKTVDQRIAAEIGTSIRERIGEVPVGVAEIAPTRLVPLTGEGQAKPLSWLEGREAVAVTSIADPRPFVQHLQMWGARTELLAFPDHHDFTSEDLALIQRRSRTRTVVMTRKEAVKLRVHGERCEAMVLEQEVRVEAGETELLAALRRAIDSAE